MKEFERIKELELENSMLRGACIYPGTNHVDDYLQLCKRINREIEYCEGLNSISDDILLSYVIKMLKGLLK